MIRSIPRYRSDDALAAVALAWWTAIAPGAARAQEIPRQIADPSGTFYLDEAECPTDGKPHRFFWRTTMSNDEMFLVRFPAIGGMEKGTLTLSGWRDRGKPRRGGPPRTYAQVRLHFQKDETILTLPPSEVGRLARWLERSQRIAADFQRTPESVSPFPRRVQVISLAPPSRPGERLRIQVEQRAAQTPEIVFTHTYSTVEENAPRNPKRPPRGMTVSYGFKQVPRSLSVRIERVEDVARLGRDAQRLAIWLQPPPGKPAR